MAKETMVSAGTTAIPIDEAVLVEQAQSGDMGAYSRLVIKYQDRILNACWRISGNIEDAHDLTQEVFLHALESLNSFRHRACFYTWLFRIAVNLSISHQRKTAKAVKLSLHDGDGREFGDHQTAKLVGRVSDDPDDPPVRLSAREIEQQVVRGLDQLDNDHRALIVLRDIESFDYQSIAEILEIPVGTVKSRLHRARLALREQLKHVLGGE